MIINGGIKIRKFKKKVYTYFEYVKENIKREHYIKLTIVIMSVLLYGAIFHYKITTQDYEQSLLIKFDEEGNPTNLYDEDGHIIKLYDHSTELKAVYDSKKNLEIIHNNQKEPVKIYDEHQQKIKLFDENGNSVKFYDSSARWVRLFNQEGKAIGIYNEDGSLDSIRDKNNKYNLFEKINSNNELPQRMKSILSEVYDENENRIQLIDNNNFTDIFYKSLGYNILYVETEVENVEERKNEKPQLKMKLIYDKDGKIKNLVNEDGEIDYLSTQNENIKIPVNDTGKLPEIYDENRYIKNVYNEDGSVKIDIPKENELYLVQTGVNKSRGLFLFYLIYLITFTSSWIYYKRKEILNEEPAEMIKDYKLLDYLMTGLVVFTLLVYLDILFRGPESINELQLSNFFNSEKILTPSFVPSDDLFDTLIETNVITLFLTYLMGVRREN